MENKKKVIINPKTKKCNCENKFDPKPFKCNCNK